MKRVVSTRQVAHLWAAHGRGETAQDSARNAKGSLNFKGETLYSYRQDIACFDTAPDGTRFVWLNTCHYSVTTSRHQREARSAVGGVKVISLDQPFTTPRAAIDRLLIRAQECRDRSSRSRGESCHMSRAQMCLEDAAWLGTHYGIPLGTLQWELDRMRRQQEGAEMWKRAGRFFTEYFQARDSLWRNLAEAFADISEGLAWLRGERAWRRTYFHWSLLRLKNAETVETDRHAEFPLAHGLKALPLIQACRLTGQEWVRGDVGPRLGHFQLDHVDAEGNVRAGCHYVPWYAIEHLVKSLPAGTVPDAA